VMLLLLLLRRCRRRRCGSSRAAGCRRRRRRRFRAGPLFACTVRSFGRSFVRATYTDAAKPSPPAGALLLCGRVFFRCQAANLSVDGRRSSLFLSPFVFVDDVARRHLTRIVQGCAGPQNEHFSSAVSVSGRVGRADVPVCMGPACGKCPTFGVVTTHWVEEDPCFI